MLISSEQRKLLTTVEDGICAFLFAVLGTLSFTWALIREPGRTMSDLRGGAVSAIVPQPLTYLAGASLMFLLSLRFARSFASFVLLQNFNSVSFDAPIKEISVSACLLAVIPTVFGLYCLSRLVTLAAGPTTSERALLALVSLTLGLELYLLSICLAVGRLVTLLAVNHEISAGVLAYCVIALMVLGFIWPVILLIKMSRLFISRHRRWRFSLFSTPASVAAPAIALGAFLLQYGHAEFQPPQTTCVLTHTSVKEGSQAIPIRGGQKLFGLAAILINRGPTTIFVIPPNNFRIVNGIPVYEGSLTINAQKFELCWNWPEPQILALEPEKSVVVTGTAVLELNAIETLQNGQPAPRGDLVADLHVLTSSGSDFSIGCVTNNVALK